MSEPEAKNVQNSGGESPPVVITKEKRPIGRPPKLTEELIEKICVLVRAGNYMETAASYVGVTRQALYNWLKKGALGRKSIYKKFADAMMKARAEAELRDVQIVSNAAANGQWQAAAWRLERRAPSRWGRRDFINAQHTGADGGPIRVETAEMPFSIDRVREAIRDLVKRELLEKSSEEPERVDEQCNREQETT